MREGDKQVSDWENDDCITMKTHSTKSFLRQQKVLGQGDY